MSVVDLLPSPHQYYTLAVSLLQSALDNYTHRPAQKRPSQADFDVDAHTGFFPRSPLTPLSGVFSVWEAALSDAGGET
ncbi:hypothetical protein MSAN_01043800 [Mycena sanguinolenta]|uniref:Uncharacterized protein n=1 Tax=Mycena sanguinolenta TaxID=230812 RepID=A0A8H6YMG5_9AGAR|nr:hypothetical protein MSAN_01043800 [Mycena sanguinolenta]